MSLKGSVFMPPRSAFDAFESANVGRLQSAALNVTHRAARTAVGNIRADMVSAGLGRLGNALDAGSDAEKYGVVRQKPGAWSASGWIFIRSGSERTRGAIKAYTEGATIRPRKGSWLWVPTDDIPARAGREDMTPTTYRKYGFEQKIGPLVRVIGPSGRPMYIVRKVGVSAAGKPYSAKSLTKRGKAPKGQTEVEFIVAFYAIDETTREGRVDVGRRIAEAVASLPGLMEQEMRRR